MARRYCIAILVILLSVGMLSVQVAAETSKTSKSSKSSKSKVVHKKKKARVKAVRAPQRLVIRSACALVEDQQTGELFVEKRATAVLPIASITKL
ncbi:MAG: peptidase S11, partial [Syntrophales bacterium]